MLRFAGMLLLWLAERTLAGFLICVVGDTAPAGPFRLKAVLQHDSISRNGYDGSEPLRESQTMSIAKRTVQPLCERQRLTVREFLRRCEAMPEVKLAELIDGKLSIARGGRDVPGLGGEL